MPSFLRRRHAFLALLTAGALALAAPAGAQSPEEIKVGRQIATEAFQAYQKNEFDKAVAMFKQARELYPSANVLRLLGYSELGLEHWEAALEALEAALDSKIGPLSKDDRKEVQDQLAKAMAHIGTITVTSKVAGAKLAVDGGEPRALPLAKPLRLLEGQHKLVVTAPEHLDATSDLKVEGGKTIEVALEPAEKPKPKPVVLPPPPPPKPERKEWVPNQRLVGLGAAGAGVALGVGALITTTQWVHWKSLAKSDQDKHLATYGNRCAMGDPRLCAYDITVTNREADTANHLRNASIGLGVTAGVLAATGVVFVVMAPKKKAPAPPADSAPPPPAASAGTTVACGLAGGLGVTCAGAF
jgi:hypothetical protein